MTAPAASFHEEDALGKAYDGRLMRRLLVYVRPYARLVVYAVLLLFCDGALQLVGPALTRRVIDVAVPAHDADAVRSAALLFALSLVAQFVCSYGETMLTSLLGQRVMRDLRTQIFAHLQRLPIAFYDRNPVGRLITRVTSDVEALNELFTAGVVAGLGDLFTLLAIAVMMVVIDWRLALASFAVIPLVYLTSHLFRVRVRGAYREIRTRLARINAFLQERLTGMRVVQLFGREKAEAQRFDALNRSHLDANLKSITIYALYFPAIEFLTSLALAALIVAGAHGVHANALSVGTVAAFLQLVRRFFQPLQDLSDKFNTLQQAMASSERIFRLLDTEAGVDAAAASTATAMTDTAGVAAVAANEAADVAAGDRARAGGPPRLHVGAEPSTERHRATAGVIESPRRGVTVAFEDVWFAYPAADPAAAPHWVLRGVNFVARPGETLAIVGHTGAGKTTVMSLLLRFYEPQRGRILIDGVDVREMPVGDLRALVGYVQQDIFLFAGDVATNIRLSSDLTDAEVIAAAERVGADRVIRRLPHGYAQPLGERGASISVGERQLLSFARAIAADPALLLLDEATSAVDSEVEAQIQRGLAVLMEGRTTIAVAHRLSTIVAADQILVMHHGEVRERGTHRELLAQRGLYDRLYRLQVGEAADSAFDDDPAPDGSSPPVGALALPNGGG